MIFLEYVGSRDSLSASKARKRKLSGFFIFNFKVYSMNYSNEQIQHQDQQLPEEAVEE